MNKTEEYYIQKLLKLPEQFKEAYFQKKWSHAKYIYDTACRVAEFLEPPKEIKKQLFGDWEDKYSEISEGLFDKEMVNEVYDMCVIKLYQGYENESYRRFGQPPQYYPYPRYPVPGYKKE